MVDTTKRKENNPEKANRRAVTERLMELIERSENYITESAKWSMRGTYATLILCGLSAVLLVATAIIAYTTPDSILPAIFGSIVIFCQISLVIWWAIFLYHGKKHIRETMDWWNQNIKPLKSRDPTLLLK